jgi:hypothetical protein
MSSLLELKAVNRKHSGLIMKVNSIFDICPIEVGRTTPQCGIGDTTNTKILLVMHIRDTANVNFFALQQKFRLLPLPVFISPHVLYHNMPSILFCKQTHCSPPSQHLALEQSAHYSTLHLPNGHMHHLAINSHHC